MKSLEETTIRPNPDFEQLRRVLVRDCEPEYVPYYELFVNAPIMEAVLGKPIVDRPTMIEFYYKAGYDYVPTWVRIALPGGSLIDRSTGYPIKDWETFEAYPWPSTDSVNLDEFEVTIPVLPDGMKMLGQTGGIFETAQQLVGYEQLCYMLADDPDLVQAIFDRLGVLYDAMYRGMAGIEQVGGLIISDYLGFKTQTLIGVNDMRKYVLPWHKKLAEIAHEAGKPCILHSCGQLSAIMDDIIDYVGIDAKHSYEDAVMPVTKAKELYGDRIGILGGFDMDLLCRSDERFVREHTRMLVTELGKGGGYALGSGNSIAPFVPVENYLTMLDEGWKLRR